MKDTFVLSKNFWDPTLGTTVKGVVHTLTLYSTTYGGRRNGDAPPTKPLMIKLEVRDNINFTTYAKIGEKRV